MEQVEEQLHYVIRRIKEIRREKSISQLELSLKTNMSQSFLASLEGGKKQPSVLTLLRIARALEVSPKAFLPEIDDKKTKDEIKDTIINLIRSL